MSLRTNPILYSVVTLWEQRTAELFLATLEDAGSAEHATLVRSLCLTKDVGHRRALRILALCTNLSHLACWVSHPDLNSTLLASDLHYPTTLSIAYAPLFRDPKRARPDFANALFSRVTHLEFKDEPQAWTGWTGFRNAPRLTHLAFACQLSHSTASAAARAIRGILESCNTTLRVLLVLTPARSHWRHQVLDVDDPRFVQLSAPADGIGDWESLARGERNNIWTVAEQIVAKRTQYEVYHRRGRVMLTCWRCISAFLSLLTQVQVDVRSTHSNCFHSRFVALANANRYVLPLPSYTNNC